MKLVTRATSISAVAAVFISMLMQMAVAVEVTSGPTLSSSSTPGFPPPQPSDREAADPGPPGEAEEPAPPSSSSCFILGSRSFSIPFSVDAAGAQPVEVHLFVSRGPDDAWQLLDRKKPNVPQKQFQFEADRDGEFWFATRTIDSLGRSHPAGAIESQLKVYVDTTKPRVTFRADADADGRVEVSLTVHDATKLKDMQLRYVTDNLKQWVNVDLGLLDADGRLQFLPADSWKQLSIQLVATDTPGNQSVVNQLLRRPRMADAGTNRYAVGPSRTSTDAIALPYRIDSHDSLETHPASNPVIKLDRHQPQPVANVTTAQGYAPETLPQGNTPFYGFRGAATPLPQSPAMISPGATGPGVNNSGMAFVPPPELAPAPQQFRSQTQAATSPQASAPYQGSIPPYGMIPQQAPPPQSLMDRLFGVAPTPSAPSPPSPNQAYPTGPSSFVPNPIPTPNSSPFGFGPPSIRGGTQVQSRFAGNVDESLPAPATPEQISNGFDLNSPGQSLPETIPVPNNAEPSPLPERARPKTPAEAMRPITDPSKVSSLTQEEVPTPQGEPEPYQSKRATPSPLPPSSSGGDVASMMERAPVRYSDSERFSLAYELEAVGVQGVEAIELYGTTDGGRSWDLWGSDPDRTSPFDIETKEAGVFGFRIVVVGNNGLASPRPLSGETPDIVVVVDTVRPVVRITGAQYGEGDRIGALVIRYECEDANLQQRPISLSFSDRIEGPWTTIAAGLRNDGEYIWTADPNLPRQLYLRIDAVDQAGNAGSYVLDQPIDAQGLAPRARIRGFQTISGVEQPTGEGQTAKRPKALFK